MLVTCETLNACSCLLQKVRNKDVILKEKNERAFGTILSKKHSPSLPTERASNAGERLYCLSFTRGRKRDVVPFVSWMQAQKLSSPASTVMCSS